MTPGDSAVFVASWKRAAKLLAGHAPDDDVCAMAFGLLSRFELGEVTAALTEHCASAVFMARPAEIIARIEGELPDDDVLVELATVDRTPLGRKVRALLGLHAMTTAHPKALAARVQALRGDIDAFRQRSLAGQQEDAELRMLTGASMDAAGPLAHGVPGTRAPFREQVRLRQKALGAPAKLTAESAVPRTAAEKANGKAAMTRILRQLNGAPYPPKPTPGDTDAMAARVRAEVGSMAALAEDRA